MNIVLILIGVVLGLLRAFGHKSQAFQAIAHLYMGGLIAAWWILRVPLYGWLVIILSLVEVVCFVAFKGRGAKDKSLAIQAEDDFAMDWKGKK